MINKEKFKLLHSIRGFAALIVVIGHSKFHFWSGGLDYVQKFPKEDWNIFDKLLFGLDMFSSNPALMVIVFFVLSGFFIAYSFENNKWKIKDFYINRTIRIYIPYIASIILTMLLFYSATLINNELFFSTTAREYNQGLVSNYQNFKLSTVAWNLIFVAKPCYIGYNDPYWSLLIEAFFYIIAPFFIKRKKIFLFVTSGFLFAGILFENIFLKYLGFKPLSNFITYYAFFFALGYYTYWLIFSYKLQDKIKKINVWFYNISASILLLSAIYGSFFIAHKYTYLLGGFFTVIMIYRMINYPVKITWINKFFISMGKISYSMYLIHVPLFIFMYSILVKFTGIEVFYSRIYWIFVVIAVSFSYLFYYAVEHQSLKLIRKFKEKLKKS
ncbi:MAG TPA: acyltransferase [Bacteroidales bacterium]|nr:acyltransferase [Bacteroidales bacterium]HPL04914.1 acyltransferase [Bacteroidales bacterium]